MRVIIAGPRTFFDYELMKDAIRESGFTITRVVCGMAAGADTLGRMYAIENGIPVDEISADWKKYGKSAGAIRNEEMSLIADALIAIDTGSPGTKNMIGIARAKGMKIFLKGVPK